MTGVPFKLRALRALTDALKQITPAAGYNCDLADFDPGDGIMTARVYRGRAWYGDGDPIPLVSILEGVNPAGEVNEAPAPATGNEYDWDLLIQGFVDDDPENPTDPAHFLLADVRRRIAIEQSRVASSLRGQPGPLNLGLGKNRIVSIKTTPGVVRPADDVSAKAWFWLNMTVRIVEDANDPYA